MAGRELAVRKMDRKSLTLQACQKQRRVLGLHLIYPNNVLNSKQVSWSARPTRIVQVQQLRDEWRMKTEIDKSEHRITKAKPKNKALREIDQLVAHGE
jgi:hypothetical protein